jgi:energy-coupling factor transporter transmembrane protein EcfT
MFKNPLVNLWFFLGFSFSLIVSVSYLEWGIHSIIFLFISLINRSQILTIFRKMKSFVFYFPIMLIIYVLFSLLLTDNSIIFSINKAIFGILKLILMVGAMTFFIETTSSQDIVILLRSLWFKMDKSWKWVDDLFLFLEMTLRFYPTFQSTWESIRNSRKALGLEIELSQWSQVKIGAKEIPGLLIHQLRRADDVAMAINLRGYGKQIPRGITYHIPVKGDHIFQMTIVVFFFLGIHSIAAI